MKWLVIVMLLVAGCSHGASDLARRQREVQNCILSGGTPEAGPDNTIICR